MCIGIPMEVVRPGDGIALCRPRDGGEVAIDMRLVGPLPAGSWVLTFLGTAREVLSAEDAARTCDALDALARVLNGENVDGLFADLMREPELPAHLRNQ